jgi:hypothetical protein
MKFKKKVITLNALMAAQPMIQKEDKRKDEKPEAPETGKTEKETQ